MRQITNFLLLTLCLSGCVSAGAEITEPVSDAFDCTNGAGQPVQAQVPDEETAIEIVLREEALRAPGADKQGYPDLSVLDRCESWAVGRYKSPEYGPDGSIKVTSGGGQLAMTIGKCDGAISDVHRAR